MAEGEAVVPGVEAWRHMWGAKVQWPAEFPDDMLKHAIGAWWAPGRPPPSVCVCVCLYARARVPHLLRARPAETTRRLLEPITDWQSQGDEVVQALKREFDTLWSPSWHVIIGKNFGSRVTHEARRMVFFYIGDRAVLIFKA